jgi:hydroxymethylbilane synthase
VRAALARVAPEIKIEVVVIKTSGDWKPEQGEIRLLESAGGKGQFAKEIEEALLDGRIDAGVHSMKDMESHMPDGLVIDYILPREDPRDCFIFKDLADKVQKLSDIPRGMVIGTSSVRRAAFLLRSRPDLSIVPLRGNVGTRLEKLRKGELGMEGIILAHAGLKRLNLENEADLVVEPDDMLPSAGQGAVGIEIVQNRSKELSIFSQISCSNTLHCVKSERAALAVLDGTCHTPIGAYATLKNEHMRLRVAVVSSDGTHDIMEDISGHVTNARDAEELGRQAGEKLRAGILPGLLE